MRIDILTLFPDNMDRMLHLTICLRNINLIKSIYLEEESMGESPSLVRSRYSRNTSHMLSLCATEGDLLCSKKLSNVTVKS